MAELGVILLIEDNPDDYESTVRSFKKANLLNPVQWCQSGREGLDYLYKRGRYAGDFHAVAPTLILLDLNMPGISGGQVLQVIKSDPHLRLVPVIILSTSSDPLDINKCYDLGASSYIQKPVGFDGLVEAAKRLKGYWFGVAILPQLTLDDAVAT